MFTDRHVIEGSIEHKVMLMSREERLARMDELLESARRYLPLLEAEEVATVDAEASDVEESGAGR